MVVLSLHSYKSPFLYTHNIISYWPSKSKYLKYVNTYDSRQLSILLFLLYVVPPVPLIRFLTSNGPKQLTFCGWKELGTANTYYRYTFYTMISTFLKDCMVFVLGMGAFNQ